MHHLGYDGFPGSRAPAAVPLRKALFVAVLTVKPMSAIAAEMPSLPPDAILSQSAAHHPPITGPIFGGPGLQVVKSCLKGRITTKDWMQEVMEDDLYACQKQAAKLDPYLADSVLSCMAMQRIGPYGSQSEWGLGQERWQSYFDYCRKWEDDYQTKQAAALQDRLKREHEQKKIHDAEFMALFVVGLIALILIYCFRYQIGRNLHNMLIGFLAICIRKRRASDRLIAKLAQQARDRASR